MALTSESSAAVLDGTKASLESVARALDPAVTERGKRLNKFTEADVEASLRLLIANGTRYTETSKLLEEEGLQVSKNTLKGWVRNSFPKMFARLRRELSEEVAERLAGDSFETAERADEAARLLIDQTIAKVDEIPPAHLAKSAQAMANAASSRIENGRLLRNEPTGINETRSIEESVAVLVRLGVLEDDDAIDAQVVSESSSSP